jgi:hypothetical protein
MITRLELKTRWKQVLDETLESEEEESVSVLCENDWVRILAVMNTEIPEEKRIEVEVSLPPESIVISSSHTSPDDLSGLELRNFVQSLIKHLEYLLRLADAGLTLGVMTREGVYTACLELEESPSDTMFDILLPPTL